MDKIIETSDDGNYHNHNENNSNDNGNNLQGLENSIHSLNQWILPPPPLHIRNTSTNNIAKTNIPKSNQCKNKNYAEKIIELHRKLIFLNENESSSNISTEEIEGTTDMQLLTSDEGSLSHQGKNNEPYVLVESRSGKGDFVLVEQRNDPWNFVLVKQRTEPSESLLVEPKTEPSESLLVEPKTEPSSVLPDTGFHILFSTNETVDITTKEDNTQKTKPIIRQKKTSKPKKAVASRSDTSFTKSRPKRACAIDRTTEDKKTGVCKLGKQKDGSWKLPIKSISLPMFQCPICNEYLVSPESRKTHEVREHSKLLEWLNNKPVDVDSTPKNEACTEEQLTLFNYLQLCETSKYKTTAVHELAKRTNFLKAVNSKGFQNMGDEIRGPTIIGSFKCNYCPYETNLIFAIWTHQYSNHLHLKYESEKKPFSYCFLCKRTLNRRIQVLRHLDACIDKHSKLPIINNPPPKQCHKCMFCDESFDSLTEFEKHIWGHAKK
ncbi:unnamed protein product [Macrosiphum euphorbiae]|uniref:C2H2-type domain-containing protein n=1 Tax=Macrosiphum euphorbiae TaxID=13131 RepID=A0AAV0YAH6_9HEMI|nr:unnamed protein product [Macrosiphum euphorbiae]